MGKVEVVLAEDGREIGKLQCIEKERQKGERG